MDGLTTWPINIDRYEKRGSTLQEYRFDSSINTNYQKQKAGSWRMHLLLHWSRVTLCCNQLGTRVAAVPTRQRLCSSSCAPKELSHTEQQSEILLAKGFTHRPRSGASSDESCSRQFHRFAISDPIGAASNPHATCPCIPTNKQVPTSSAQQAPGPPATLRWRHDDASQPPNTRPAHETRWRTGIGR